MDAAKNGWPERPTEFPEIMVDVEAAMFLRLDDRPIRPGLRMLRYLRQERGLPSLGRCGGKMLYSRVRIIEWLEKRGEQRIHTPHVSPEAPS